MNARLRAELADARPGVQRRRRRRRSARKLSGVYATWKKTLGAEVLVAARSCGGLTRVKQAT